MDKRFVIYRHEERITVKQALALEEDWSFLYVPLGPYDISNASFIVAALNFLSTINQIDSFVYLGPELPVLESEEGKIY